MQKKRARAAKSFNEINTQTVLTGNELAKSNGGSIFKSISKIANKAVKAAEPYAKDAAKSAAHSF